MELFRKVSGILQKFYLFWSLLLSLLLYCGSSEQRRLFWKASNGPGQWPSPGSFPPLHCCHLLWAFPTPRGPRKEEQLEMVLILKAVHFTAWQLSLGRDLASVWFGDYLRVSSLSLGARLLLQSASGPAGHPAAISLGRWQKALPKFEPSWAYSPCWHFLT